MWMYRENEVCSWISGLRWPPLGGRFGHLFCKDKDIVSSGSASSPGLRCVSASARAAPRLGFGDGGAWALRAPARSSSIAFHTPQDSGRCSALLPPSLALRSPWCPLRSKRCVLCAPSIPCPRAARCVAGPCLRPVPLHDGFPARSVVSPPPVLPPYLLHWRAVTHFFLCFHLVFSISMRVAERCIFTWGKSFSNAVL